MSRATNTKRQKDHTENNSDTALTAVAFQDHLLLSIGTLTLNDPLRSRKLPGHKPKNYRKEAKSVVDTGLNRQQVPKKLPPIEKEYVLDPKPPAPTLAQKLGLIDKPKMLLTEEEWSNVKHKSNEREDSKQPCVICKEDFGNTQQVLLSCSHVFHRTCLEAFERFSGKKTCPMCRREQYQMRVIHEGAKEYRYKCATIIQSQWRGYVVRCWYKKLRKSVPPKDPGLRQKFYEEKLSSITERMIRSIDFDVNGFLREIDHSLEASRDVFKNFDNMMRFISEEEWEEIQLKVVQREDTDCPICLTELDRGGITSRLPKPQPVVSSKPPTSSFNHSSHSNHYRDLQSQPTKPTYPHNHRNSSNTGNAIAQQNHNRVKLLPKPKNLSSKGRKSTEKSSGDCQTDTVTMSNDHRDMLIKQKVLLSCSHIFHMTCLQAFEELAEGDRKFTCPVCRSSYHKRIV